MKSRLPNETDAHYIKRLEDANAGLRADNKRLSDWCGRIGEVTFSLATDASLVFQAMAERAGVRGDPTVTKMVALFDRLANTQWPDKPISKAEVPETWQLDGDDVWSGDADIGLASPISDVIELLEAMAMSGSVPNKWMKPLREAQENLQRAIRRGVEGVKDRGGFKPKHIVPAGDKLSDLTAEQLRERIRDMGWMALDLAQDMHFANHMLRRDLRAASYRRVCSDLYGLSQFDFEEAPGPIDIKVFGGEPA